MKGEGYTQQERIERGRRASEVLNSDVLAEAFAASRAQFIEEWLGSNNPDAQLAAWAKVHALEAVKDDLRRTVSDGVIAAESARRSS